LSGSEDVKAAVYILALRVDIGGHGSYPGFIKSPEYLLINFP